LKKSEVIMLALVTLNKLRLFIIENFRISLEGLSETKYYVLLKKD